jgi:hypothetical protein
MEPEEPDWDALWRRIVADAEQYTEAWRRQARWFEEGTLPSPDEWYAAQRRASKAFIREWQQTVELADAINRGDIATYIERWYPQAAPPNGPAVSFITSGEYSITLYTEISRDEYEAFVSAFEHPNCRRDYQPQDSVNPAAIRRKFSARGRKKRQPQAGTASVNRLPTRQKGARGVGQGPSLRDRARRVLRRR